jgi:uncharacterized protein (TIGR00255 family)
MTGYGAATLSGEFGEFFVEVKSLNNRFLDLGIKVPKELNYLDPQLREQVRGNLRRGKVELFLRWVPAAGLAPLYEINQSLLRHYSRELREALGDGGGIVDAGALLALPGVVIPAHADADNSALAANALEAAKAALTALDRSRETEGRALVAAVEGHLRRIEDGHREIARVKDELLQEIQAKLRERIASLAASAGVAPEAGRLEMELALQADKSDITEELVRLKAHIAAFLRLCNPDVAEPVGKSMDFLVQELLREVNTIGNKARGIAAASRVLELKGEIEKIREQVQNLE